MNEHAHGYRPDLENVENLIATSRPRYWAQLYSASCDRPLDGRIREKIKSRVIVEGQGRTNSCGGHAGSTVVEFNRWLECEQLDQRSRWAAYIWGQEECGIDTDSGVQIDGLCRALSSKGLCEDALWKFTGTYHRSPAGGAEALSSASKTRQTAGSPAGRFFEEVTRGSRSGCRRARAGLWLPFPGTRTGTAASERSYPLRTGWSRAITRIRCCG
jgi:hypothetical protein